MKTKTLNIFIICVFALAAIASALSLAFTILNTSAAYAVLSQYEFSENENGELTITDTRANLKVESVVSKTTLSNGLEMIEYKKNILKIPSEFNGKPVVSIGEEAFRRLTYQVEVVIPKTVRNIGDRAFLGTHIKKLSFEDGSVLESVGKEAFRNCYLLSEVALPSSLKKLGSGAFMCAEVSSFSFGEGTQLSEIEPETFRECRRLTEIVIPKTVGIIGDYAFSGTPLRYLYFEENSKISEIRSFAFDGYLEQIFIPSSLKSCENAFERCKSEGFPQCRSFFFEGRSVSEDFLIASNLKSYYEKEIDVKYNVREIVKQGGVRYALFKDHAELITVDENCEKDLVLPKIVGGKTLTAICKYSMQNVAELKSIVVPDTVKDIGKFGLATHIDSVSLPQSLETVTEYSLGGITTEKLVLPDSVKVIETSAFEVSRIKYIYIRKMPDFIGDYAFCNLTGICTILTGASEADAAFSGDWSNGVPVIYSYDELLKNDDYIYKVEENVVTLVRYIGNESEVEIPQTIDGKRVAIVKKDCFYSDLSEQTFILSHPVVFEDGAISVYRGGMRTLVLKYENLSYGYEIFAEYLAPEHKIIKYD
ncbi:MAG: leucine-rich repeat protein [Clostridia bacterium]|nr:leucine-rich repeat protein [Clostridia bacterium]